MSTVSSLVASPPVDLRSDRGTMLVERALGRVEAALQVRLDRGSAVRKRRSVGTVTERDTWVRVEARPVAKLFGQGNGVEAAAALEGIAKPVWHASLTWDDTELGVQWRADETSLVPDAPIKPGGTLTVDPMLDDRWWERLNASLDALTATSTTRVSTVHTELMTQDRLTAAIAGAFGQRVDTTVEHWVPAHGDLNWANLTAPVCWVLDWEDWGRAPRGLDAATLWRASLAMPALAERVRSRAAVAAGADRAAPDRGPPGRC
ncbi:MAG: hypothetical protein ACR2GH_08325 [Pseudonocardia sp.]